MYFKKAFQTIILISACSFFIVFNAQANSEYTSEKIKIIEQSYKSDIPTWLLIERGREAFELGEYGLASRVFREVISREKVSPDAEMWLGIIFEQEGEYLLAEKQYLKVLEYKNQLYMNEEEFTILNRLSEIYEKTNEYGKYEKTLLTIIEKDEEYRDNFKILYAMNDVLKERGLDKLFELYRFKKNKFNKARTELGIFYYRTGRYSDAQINLVVSIMSILTTGFDYIYDKTYTYEYTDFETHIESMLDEPVLKEFIDSNNLFMTLYYLAASLYAEGYLETSAELWEIISVYDEPGSTWRIRSERQLQAPFIEPIITHRS